MAHLVVTVALLFLAYAYASPAPEPGKPKFTLLQGSSFGAAAGSGFGNTNLMLQQDVAFESPIDTGDSARDFTLLENFNTGYAVAGAGGAATAVQKDN